MNFIEYYYKNVIKYDLLNRFHYKTLNKIPKLNKIVLNFGCKDSNFMQLVSPLIALELITSQKGLLTFSKKSNIVLKIRKGNPIGCKVILKKETMYLFLEKLILNILSNLTEFSINSLKSSSLTLKNPLIFSELEQQYYFFKNVPKLQITIVSNSKNFYELLFLLKSLKLLIK